MTKHVTLNVSGDAELAVVADYATISVSTEVNEPTREAATQAIPPLLNRLRAALVDQPDARNASISRLRVTHQTRWDRKKEEHVDAVGCPRQWQRKVVAADLKSFTARVLAADADFGVHWQRRQRRLPNCPQGGGTRGSNGSRGFRRRFQQGRSTRRAFHAGWLHHRSATRSRRAGRLQLAPPQMETTTNSSSIRR